MDEFGDRSNAKSFLNKVCILDNEKELDSIMWNTFSENIRLFLNNKFIFQPFWDEYNMNKIKNEKNWQELFENENRKAFQAMANQNTSIILNIVFRRLYTLRNQILHGGSTFNSCTNKNQKKEACRFLQNVMPIIIKIIMNNDEEDWGKPYYPVVK